MRRVSFGARIHTTLAAGMAVVLCLGFASYRAIDQLASQASAEILSYQAVNRAETLVVRWKDAQASHLRLLASRADSDEGAYRTARARTVDALASARSAFFIAGDGDRFAPIEDAVHRGLIAMDKALEVQATGPSGEAEALARADGPAMEAGIESAVQAVRDVEVGRIEQSHAQAMDRAEWSRFGLAGGTLVSLSILALAMLAIRRNRIRRRQVEGRLRASELQLREITDAVPALIAYVDSDRRYRFHNRAYQEYFGLGKGEIDGRTLWEVIGDDVYASVRAKVDEALSGYPVRYEHARVTPNGSHRDFAVHLFPRYGEGHREGEVIGFYSLMTDVTELKRIDRMKTEFVSTVSHELRTPLTSIRGSLGLLAGGVSGALPEPARKLVDIARNNCERLIRLINDILDTEKIESGKMRFEMKELQLAPFISDALQANEGFAQQHGVRLRFAAPDEPIHVDADPDRLNQVLANLLSNAIKFSPRGAEVVVALARQDSRARVEIRDHGAGIPAEFRGRIFQKFSQADASDSRQKGGTGLGLNISKAIVERLNGTIGFTSETGAGTTFHFELPATRPAPRPPAAIARTRPCVLVCEDDPDIARLLSMFLEKAGFECETARLGAEALGLAKTKPYAAMTVDLRLPDMDGIALIHALRREPRLRDLPIVVVSAHADEGRIQVNSEALSVSDWLAKPIDENRFVAALRDAVDGERRSGPRVLHVEDDPDIQRVAATIAADFASFEFAGTLQEARSRLGARFFDLVLLDLKLPDGSGWDLVPEIRRLEARPRLVVFSVDDVSAEQASRADAVLLKSCTSNEKLLQTLRDLLPRRERAAA